MVTELANDCARVDGRSQYVRRSLIDVLFSRHAACFSAVCLLFSFFLPVDGLGVTVCWFKSCYGLPCPGCGLTRSITCISHLEFGKAWQYHPFGSVVYALFVANVVLLIVPKARRRFLNDKILANDRWLRIVYLAFVLSFLTFGCLRVLCTLQLS